MCETLVTLTDDGVLFAKNSDRDANESQALEHVPARDGSGALRVTHTSVPGAPSYAVLLSRPWWLWGAEMGANEHGVVIGNEAVFTRGVGRREGVLTGMDLVRLGLERGADRHEAVQVIVSMLEEYGQGGSCSYEHPRFTYDSSFVVADRDGATVLETAGRHWATEEVTGSRSISNGLTIAGFAERFADPVKGTVAACAVRRERTEESAGRASSVLDMFAALRDHGSSSGPVYSPVNGALSAPCAHAGGLVTSTQTTASWVAEATAGRHWVTATAAPCTSVFKPIRVEPLPLVEAGELSNAYDATHLWWRHERMHRDWVRNPDRYVSQAAARDALERSFVEGVEPAGAWDAAAAWEEVPGQPCHDARPVWVRALWSRWDRQAGVWA